jgi:methanogenic corrinoid protein MtbC1
VDVPPARFLRAAAELHPDVIGISGLITGSYQGMKATVELLKEHRSELVVVPPVLLGGGVDQEVMMYTGADTWTNDAIEGVRICQRLMERETALPSGDSGRTR